jgi:hypothetical protein
MRSLVVAALRLLILLKIIEDAFSTIYSVVLYVPSTYGWDWESALHTVFPNLGSLILYLAVFWKAPWLVDRMRISDADIYKMNVSGKTIVASGLILFGLYGIARQFLYSSGFLYDLLTGQPISAVAGGDAVLSAVFTMFRLLVYVFCILEAGRIAQFATRQLEAEPAQNTESAG